MPGLVATSVASNGSVANVAAIAAGTAQSGFVQSDIAYWAYNGTGIYQGRPKVDVLRAIANLYPESIQLVVRKGSGIKSVADLRGRKVSLDEPGSGTLVDARLILSAYGLSEKDLKAEYFRAQQVADSLKDGTIDAFFSVSGWPQSAVADLAATVGIELVPIAGPEVDKLIAQFSFFSTEEIPDNAYKGVAGVKTVSVHALWATSSKQSDELIYKVTAALWNPATRKLLELGPRQGPRHPPRDGDDGPRHSAACRRRKVLQGTGPDQVAPPIREEKARLIVGRQKGRKPFRLALTWQPGTRREGPAVFAPTPPHSIYPASELHRLRPAKNSLSIFHSGFQLGPERFRTSPDNLQPSREVRSSR